MILDLVPVNLTGKGQRYAAVLDGRELVRSRQPFFDAARVLLGEGVPPETQLKARFGSGAVSMRSTVGEAAKWTVVERSTRLSRELWNSRQDADCSAVG